MAESDLLVSGPLISVMVPTYNQATLVGECLDSILTQDYRNLEVVVADDGSTDGTVEVLRAYAARDARVKLIENGKNVGVTENCAQAFSRCTGKYVSMFAGDDVMLPGKLQAQVAYMESHPDCVLSYHDVEVFDSDSGRVLYLYNSVFEPKEGSAEALVQYGMFCCGCSVMVRRDAAPPHIYVREIGQASDWYFCIEIAARGRVGYINQLLGRYRKHGGSVTRSLVGMELHTTLELVDATYPQYRRSARRYRMNRFHRVAARAILQRRFRIAAAYLTSFASAVAKELSANLRRHDR